MNTMLLFDDYQSTPVNFITKNTSDKHNVGVQHSQDLHGANNIKTQTAENEKHKAKVDRVDVLNFLKHTIPMIVSELDKTSKLNNPFLKYDYNRNTTASLRSLDDSFSDSDEGYDDVVKYKYSLSWSLSKVDVSEGNISGNNNIKGKTCLEVTCLSWSTSELLIGVGYGHNEYQLSSHNNNHSKGAVCFWNLSSRNNYNPNNPTYILHHTSSITTLSSHPEKQYIFAAGTFHGEVLLIDLTEAELNANNNVDNDKDETTETATKPKVYKSKIDDYYFHKEPVTCVNWILLNDINNKQTKRSSSSSRHYCLSSISCDGKILFWNTVLTTNSNNKFRYPIGGLLLQESDDKRSRSNSSRSYSSINNNHKSLFYGGTKMCLSSSSSSCYQYVGTIAGSIIRIQNNLLLNKDAHNKNRKPDGIKLKWSKNAIQALHFLQQQDPQLQISKLAKLIEEKAISKRKKGVDLACMYEIAKPPIDMLFPCCINDNDNKNKDNPSSSSFFQYASHGSSITSIQSNTISSYNDNKKEDLILTSSLDGELRLYSGLYYEPLLILEPNNISTESGTVPLYDAQFSPYSPTIFATSSQNGNIYIYDLLSSDSTMNPHIILKVPTNTKSNKNNDNDTQKSTDNNSATFFAGSTNNSNNAIKQEIHKNGKSSSSLPTPVHSMAFHKEVPNLLAAGDGNGIVHIWQLPSNFILSSRSKDDEFESFKSLNM